MIYIQSIGLVNALGHDCASITESLQKNRSGLVEDGTWLLKGEKTFIGKITGELPIVPNKYQPHNTRNNQILLQCLAQIKRPLDASIEQYGRDRIAIIMGTSTSGIYEGELAVKAMIQENRVSDSYQYQQQCLSDPSDFLAQYLNLKGPSYTISTACTSSGRAVMSGAKLIEAGIVDVALVGGADSLCQMTINGFHSLSAISSERCKPFSEDRSGINIGEGGGLMILSKERSSLALLGSGASSDAWHISAPHPEGEGAFKAMHNALIDAELLPHDLGYINLHGTATVLNDSAEAKAVYALFGDQVWGSSTKSLTGHTLGAAGITELGLSALILHENLPLPKQLFSEKSPRDPNLSPLRLVENEVILEKPMIASNSFAFGGNNVSLIIGRV